MDSMLCAAGLIHCRSYFSLLEGLYSPESIVQQAALAGLPAVGMVDRNNFYGLVRFLKACEHYGIRPIAGVDLVLEQRRVLTLYCINRKGFSTACGLLSAFFLHKRHNTLAAFKPVSLLLETGWDGLWIASEHTDVLEALYQGSSNADSNRVFALIQYGRQFSALVRWAQQRGIPLLALQDCVYHNQEDADFYRVLRAVDQCIPVQDIPQEELLEAGQGRAADKQLLSFFSAIPDALENAEKLVQISEASAILPAHFVFPQFEGLNDAEAFGLLRSKCAQGINRRYGKSTAAIQNRLNYELGIIRDKGFSGYFLVVEDIVSQVSRTCGRGSSAASLVSFLLGITHVDPIRHNLFFERFLNRSRKDPPDIDVDFPWDEREQALSYVFTKYCGRAGMVADHVTFAERSSLREAAKAFGCSEQEMKRLAMLRRTGNSADIPDYIRSAAQKLYGMPRYLGTHPGGVVITPGPITCYTTVQYSTFGVRHFSSEYPALANTDRPIIAWEKDATEDAGLVKIDLLGNRSLAVLRDTLCLVNRQRPTPILWEDSTVIDDTPTRRLMEQGKTLGVFYVESPATRQLLQKMGHGDFEHLVIASSIIRPAANKAIQEYLRRLHGGPWKPLAACIEKTLKDTLGIMVYQEDVSRVAIDACGFTSEEADALRKILSKKDRWNKLETFKQRFFSGGLSHGLSERILTQLWEMILSFTGYSFCKPHSASYALVSYKLAFLKRCYPLEFFASVINNGGGFYCRQTYLDEVRRMGFPILGPDINESAWEYRVITDTRCGIKALRVGLCQLREIALPFVRRILLEREKAGAFTGIEDFYFRLLPKPAQDAILIRSGALDSIASGLTQPQLFWTLHMLRVCGKDLFGTPKPPECIRDYSFAKKLRDEVETLSVIFSRSPLDIFLPRIQKLIRDLHLPRVIDSRMIRSLCGFMVAIPGFYVTAKEVSTVKKTAMCFVSFEDNYGIFETTLFPDIWQKDGIRLEEGSAFLILGRICREYQAFSIEVQRLLTVSQHKWSSVLIPAAHSSMAHDS